MSTSRLAFWKSTTPRSKKPQYKELEARLQNLLGESYYEELPRQLLTLWNNNQSSVYNLVDLLDQVKEGKKLKLV